MARAASVTPRMRGTGSAPRGTAPPWECRALALTEQCHRSIQGASLLPSRGGHSPRFCPPTYGASRCHPGGDSRAFFFIIIVSRGNADGGLADLALGILPDLGAVAINAGRDEEAQIPSEREGEIAMTAWHVWQLYRGWLGGGRGRERREGSALPWRKELFLGLSRKHENLECLTVRFAFFFFQWRWWQGLFM